MALLTESVSKPNVHKRIDALAVRLRRRQLIGSREVALEVVRLFRDVVAGARFSPFDQLLAHLEEIGRVLQDAGPKELVVTNMTRRICMLIREEYQTALSNHLAETGGPSGAQTPIQVPQTPSLNQELSGTFMTEQDLPIKSSGALGSIFDLLGHKSAIDGVGRASYGFASADNSPTASTSSTPIQSPSSSQILQRPSPATFNSNFASYMSDGDQSREEVFSRRSYHLKPVFIEAIQELMDEVETTYRSVGEQALDHIHPGEFILTIGHSKTVEAFLKNAARKRKFTVICAETAPSFSGRDAAVALSAAGIPTILIPDSNIFALLPRCSKVLLGPHVILADGALLSITGSLPLCLAANRMRVPVVAVGGMFKFSPVYLGEADWGMRDLGSPEEVLKSTEECVAERGGDELDETEVLNPYYDVVPAEIVDLYISNLGGHPSSLLYRLLNDMYGSS
ncbi:hypothetical protein NBRC10512_002409 [Rhodotorula toruloides]|uniref:Translation initiation factor eIF2B subunit beta n=2 Tax=Rhodotorula toruloides TaxID=5286 RepID=A0A061AS59_RHOTO|nr:translation initiation factor eIF-2B beta subunit [Rhodotorula toruloides NP11]EMS25873.1 translation initiation factor eIF-2B beta subunit [Rhodotorula toruloides NP11]CDR38216.1 RHTO0S03e06040g1_1 [Rhodotorula toruloides]